ncbi:MAG: methionyl-tRNA formyltransferase [Fibrobacteria bacterium]|nr:methionyl-tRNA formyltransferase [Fibrobacteria bacterium]
MGKIKRVLFIGSKHLGLEALKKMYSLSPDSLIGILTIDDSNDTRSVLNDFQHFSNQNALILHAAKNRKESEKILLESKPDLCIVVGWYWLIGKEALDSVPYGLIGVHNSLLPKYRGGAPLIWPIINNEKKVGISFFSITQRMDEGNIWAQGSVSVGEQDYISDILKKLDEKIIQVLQDNYLQILDSKITPVEQEHELATYCAQRFPGDGNINWNKSARDIYNFIRAQSTPYPGAFTYFGSQELKIWRARIFDKTYYGTPGQVARISSDGVYVICGDHKAIILEEVELGGKRGNAVEFIKSIKGRMCSIIAASITDKKI